MKNLIKNKVFQGSFIILLGTTLANGINYLYHLFTGRLLGPENYGLLSGFIGTTYFLGVLTSTLSISIINLLGSKKENEVAPLIRLLEKKILFLSFPFWFFLLLLFPLFKNTLHFEGFTLFFVYSLQLFFIFIPTIYSATLQARLRFFHFALITVAIALTKLLSALFFIKLGGQVLAALSSLLVAGLVSLFLGKILTKKFWPLPAKQPKKVKLNKGFWSYSVLTFVTNLSLVSLISTDIILARFHFSSFDSGLYSAATNLGKIIYFTAFSALTVAFPLFIKHKNNPKRLKTIFHLSLLLITFLCTFATILYKTFPQFITNLLYGKAFEQASSLMFLVAINFSLYTLFHLLIQILLAKGKKEAAFITTLAAIAQIIILTLNHASPTIFIQNNIVVLTLICLLTFIPVAKIIYVPQKT